MRDIYENFEVVSANEEVVIWGFNQKTLEIFLETINRRIWVVCFVDTTGYYLGKEEHKFLGKPVISRDKLLCEEYLNRQLFFLIDKNSVEVDDIKWIEKHWKNRYYVCQACEIDATIRNSESIYIYGAGSAGQRTYELLDKEGITVSAFIDSDCNKWGKRIENCVMDAAIYGPNILDERDIIIVSASYYNDIKEALLKRGIQEKNIFVDIRNSWEYSKKPICYEERRKIWFEYAKYRTVIGVEYRHFISVMMMDICNRKRIILHGVNEFTIQFISLFRTLDIEICYCTDNIKNYKEIANRFGLDVIYKDVYELVDENMDDKIVYTIKLEGQSEEIGQINYTKLERLGMVFFKDIRPFKDENGFWFANRNPKIEAGFGLQRDKLLGYTFLYKKTSRIYPGYVVIGNEKSAKKRIMILGGSTSDVGFYEFFIKSWVEFLGDYLTDTVIFCGAITGYDSKQELLKLLRDGRQLHPDLIISYGGYNDVGGDHTDGYPYARGKLDAKALKQSSWGIKTNTKSYEEWIESEKLMKLIATSYGAEFIGIFQPIIINRSEEKLTFKEKVSKKLVIWTDLTAYQVYQREVLKRIQNIEYIYDMTNLFYNEEICIFRDLCHLTEKGNQILGKAVYRLIRQMVKN